MKNNSVFRAPVEKYCGFCHRSGAEWQVRLVSGEKIPVHKNCGEALVSLEAATKVVPSTALRERWKARNFWGQKLQEAKAPKAAFAATEARKAAKAAKKTAREEAAQRILFRTVGPARA